MGESAGERERERRCSEHETAEWVLVKRLDEEDSYTCSVSERSTFIRTVLHRFWD